MWEILCSVSPHIVSGFFLHLQYKYTEGIHVISFYMFQTVVVQSVDQIFPRGAGVPGYSVLIFGVGHFDVIHVYTGAMTYCETI